MTFDEIKEIIDTKKFSNINEIYSFFNKNIEYTLVACYLLKIESDFIEDLYNQIPQDEDRINDLADKYGFDKKLLFKVVPKNLHTALILYQNFFHNDLSDVSSKIINLVESKNDYLKELKKHEIFNDLVMFSTKVNLKSEDLISILIEKVKSLDLIFLEEAHLDLCKHFQVYKYFHINQNSQNDLLKLVKDYYQDIIDEHPIKFKGNYKDNYIDLIIVLTLLEESFFEIKEFNYKLVFEKFLKELKSEVSSETKDIVLKKVFASSIGIEKIDIALKFLKVFLKSFADNSYNNKLTISKIEEHYLSFKSSGEENIRDWYINKLKKEFNPVNREYFDDKVELSENFYNKQYIDFISNYYYLLLNLVDKKDNFSQTSHNYIFNKVYELSVLYKDFPMI